MERGFKYHGLGNDFVVLDRRSAGSDLDAESSRRLCDRRRGVGADGVLVLLPSERAVAKMVVHNADGSIAEMCGNGLRCAVKYLVDRDPARPASLQVETGAGVLTCAVEYGAAREAAVIEVSMGPALLVADNLPSGRTGKPFIQQPVESGLSGTAVSMGNPHLVLFDTFPEAAPTLGPRLENNELFPDRTNVEFCTVRGERLDVVVWERGVGLTQACGTGACAALAAAALEKRLPFDRWIPVGLPGGELHVWVKGDLSEVRLRGPATFVFEAGIS
jgi:diaminopimelate epimerase